MDFFMFPIEFYVEFNLTDKVKPYSERNREETKNMFFFFRRPFVVGMMEEYRGKLLVRSS